MRIPFLLCALCWALVAGASGCGGDDATTTQTQDSASATADTESGGSADGGGGGNADGESEENADGGGGEDADGGESAEFDAPLETPASEVLIGDYEGEGPFAAVSGQKGNRKPRFTPSGQPAPKKVAIRDLEVGTGPAARRGDEVSVYYAGAIYETGQVELYGWPPSAPSTFELGSGLYGRSWEKTIEGMKVGGIRQVILPSSEFAGGKPVDYVIVMTALEPKSE